MTKITISELIQLVYDQIESKSEEERFDYVAETKKLYKLCKKSLIKKLKERFNKCLIIMKKFLRKIKIS